MNTSPRPLNSKNDYLTAVGESPEESDSVRKLMQATLACCNTEKHAHFRVPLDNLIADIIVEFLKPLSFRRRVVQKAVETRRSNLRKENYLLDTNEFRKKVEGQALTEEKKWVKSMRWLRENLRMNDGTEEFINWFHKLMLNVVDDLMTTVQREASGASVSKVDQQPRPSSHHTQPGPSKDPIQIISDTPRPSRKSHWDSTEQPMQRHNQFIRRTLTGPSSSGTPIPVITIEDDEPGPSTRTNQTEEAWNLFRMSTQEEPEERMKKKKMISDEAATIHQKMFEFIELNPSIVNAILTEGQKKKAGDQQTSAAIRRVAKQQKHSVPQCYSVLL